MLSVVLIIIDGLADRPIKELGGKTPLEAAKTPNMDFMAQNGLCGLIEPFKFQNENTPTSEGTHVALLGDVNNFLGRGPYEAEGAGINLKKGDIAFRVNFASVDKNLKLIDRRAGRIKNTVPLAEALNKIKTGGIRFILKETIGHRAALVLRGKNLSSRVSSNDPKTEGGLIKKIKPLIPKARFTAEILNKYLEQAHCVLNNHRINKKRKIPANYLLLRGAGQFKKIPSFKEKYKKQACSINRSCSINTSCSISSGGVYMGISKILGMKIIPLKKATGDNKTDLKEKISTLKKCAKKYDFVFCHIKGTDNFSHDGDFLGKKKFIEKIDKSLKPLLISGENNLNNAMFVITGDHASPCVLKNHSSDFIPVLIYGRVKHNNKQVKKFSEKESKKGSLGIIKQKNLLEKIFALTKLK